MASVNPVQLKLWTYEKTKSGKAPIKLTYNFQGRWYKKATGYFATESNWDSKNEVIKKPEEKRYNDELHTLKSKLEKLVRDYRLDNNTNPTVDYIKENFEPHKKKKYIFKDFIDDYIESKRQIVGKESMKDYNSFRNVYLEFEEHEGKQFTFNDFNKQVFERFQKFLVEKRNLHNNTIANRFKRFNAILNYYYELGYHNLTFYRSFNFPKKYQPEPITLSDYELNLIKNHTTNKKYLQKVQDLFLFGCMVGLRYSDLSQLGPEHFEEKTENKYYITLRTKKTTEFAKPPVLGTALQIAKKYDFQLPKISLQKFNKYIKELLSEIPHFRDNTEKQTFLQGKQQEVLEKPKYEFIGTHTMRRTFVTRCLSKGVPNPTIQAWTGLSLRVIPTYLNQHQGTDEYEEQIEFAN